MESTKWWASKTLWLNALAGIAAAGGAFGVDLGLTPDAQVAIVGGALAVLNIVLRLVTTKPIAGTNGT